MALNKIMTDSVKIAMQGKKKPTKKDLQNKELFDPEQNSIDEGSTFMLSNVDDLFECVSTETTNGNNWFALNLENQKHEPKRIPITTFRRYYVAYVDADGEITKDKDNTHKCNTWDIFASCRTPFLILEKLATFKSFTLSKKIEYDGGTGWDNSLEKFTKIQTLKEKVWELK